MQHHHIQFHCRLDRRHIGPSPSLNKIRVQHIIRLFPSGTHVKMNTFPRICLSIDLTLMTHTAICLIRVSNDVERQLDLVFVSEVCPNNQEARVMMTIPRFNVTSATFVALLALQGIGLVNAKLGKLGPTSILASLRENQSTTIPPSSPVSSGPTLPVVTGSPSDNPVPSPLSSRPLHSNRRFQSVRRRDLRVF